MSPLFVFFLVAAGYGLGHLHAWYASTQPVEITAEDLEGVLPPPRVIEGRPVVGRLVEHGVAVGLTLRHDDTVVAMPLDVGVRAASQMLSEAAGITRERSAAERAIIEATQAEAEA